MPRASSSRPSILGSLMALGVLALVVGGGVYFLVQRERAAAARSLQVAEAELVREKAARQRLAPAPEAEPGEEQLAVAPPSVEVATLQAEVESLRRQLAEARAEADVARAAAVHAGREAQRYQKGLERAVDELNRQAGAAVEKPPSSPPAPATDVKAYYGPSVFLVGDNVQVAGKVGNFGPTAHSFTLTIELQRNGFTEATQNLPLTLGPGETAPFQVDFGARGQHDFTASVRVD